MDRPIKIALVSPYDHAFPGGVAAHISELAAQFESWGHSVKLIAPCSAPERIQQDNFIHLGRPVPVPSGGSIARVSFSVWLQPKVKALLRQEQFDVVHLHEPFAGFIPYMMLRMSNAVNIATFHTFRGTRLYRVGKHLLMRDYRKLDGRIAVSTPAYQFISRHFPGDYEIIPNGIRVDLYANAAPFPHLLDGKLNLLFVGRLEKRKGLKYLLSAFSRLKWDWPELRLIVVGPGKPDDDSYRIMSERNLQDVVFVGRVSDQEKARYYKSAHVYCSPATGRESFGIVLLEAMAAGAPIVASAIEGYSSVIENEVDGLLVPPKDDAALADAIARLLKDPGLRSSLAARARCKVEEYRWERIAGRVLDYYRTFLDSRAMASSE